MKKEKIKLNLTWLIDNCERSTNRYMEDEKFLLSLLDMNPIMRVIYFPLMWKISLFLKSQMLKYDQINPKEALIKDEKKQPKNSKKSSTRTRTRK